MHFEKQQKKLKLAFNLRKRVEGVYNQEKRLQIKDFQTHTETYNPGTLSKATFFLKIMLLSQDALR